MTVTFAIVGASFAGLTIAHKLLKHSLPKHKDLKVVIISETTHWYHNIAAVRGVLPELIADDQLFFEIAPNLQKYPAESYELIIGKAEKLDTTANTIEVSVASETRTISYDYVLLATGAAYAHDLPFKTVNSYEKTREELHKLQANITKAKSIIVVGGGAVGTEVIAELGENFGKKKDITWIIGEARALESIRNDLGPVAESKVKEFGVKVLTGSRVQSTAEVGEQTEVTLANGEKLTADLYLPLTGMTPNSSYVPKELLDDKGYVKVNDHLRSVDTPNLYAIGDVSNREANYAISVNFQFEYLYPELEARLSGKDAGPKAYGGPPINAAIITLGKKAGTGIIGWFKAPSFLVPKMKGTTLFVDKTPDFIGGIKSSVGKI